MTSSNYTYSKFGSIYTGAIGGQGASGAGFTIDSNGNYDIGGKKLVDVNEIITGGIDSTTNLTIQSAGVERIVIPSSGIALDNTATNVLALSSAGSGTTLVYKDDLLDADSTVTLTNKTISANSNTITVTTDFDPETNINDIINQRLTTLSSVDFLDIDLVGGIDCGGAGQFSQVLTAAINDATLSNLCTVNGVNPLTTSNDLATHVAASTAHGTTSTIVGINDSQRLTNKNIAIPSCKLVDNSDATKIVNFANSGATTGTNTQLTFAQTANRVITFPNATTTVVGTDTTDTLTNKLIEGARYWDGTGQTMQLNTSGVTGPRTWTVPDADGTVTLIAASQTLSNKTVDSSNTINGCSIRGATYTTAAVNSGITFDTTALGAPRSISWIDSAGTVALIAATQTLTNKTVNSASNTITITNSPLSAVNVNSLINQDIRTSASPSFIGLGLGSRLTMTTTTNTPVIINHTTSSASNELLFQENGTDVIKIGADQPGNTSFLNTIANRDFLISTNNTERIRVSSAGVTTFSSDQIRVSTAKTPASPTATGTTGTICWDSDYLYVCIATNSWKRVGINTLLW